MARPKAPQASVIETKINNKIKSLNEELRNIQAQLDEWEKISNDYQINKVTVESILSLHAAPDLSAPRKTRTPKDKRPNPLESIKNSIAKSKIKLDADDKKL